MELIKTKATAVVSRASFYVGWVTREPCGNFSVANTLEFTHLISAILVSLPPLCFASHHLLIHKHLMSTVFVPGNVSEMQSWVDKKFSPEPGGGDRHANRLYNHVKRASTVVHEAKVREGADPLPEGTRSGLSEDVAMLSALSEGSCLQGSTGKCTHSYDTKQCWEPPLEI